MRPRCDPPEVGTFNMRRYRTRGSGHKRSDDRQTPRRRAVEGLEGVVGAAGGSFSRRAFGSLGTPLRFSNTLYGLTPYYALA